MGTVPDQIRIVADRWPNGVASQIVHGPAMTYAEWVGGANRLARSLVKLGVGRGDPVVLAFDDHDMLAHMQAYLAVQKAGGYCVVVPMYLSGSEIREVVFRARPLAVIGSGSALDDLRVVVQGLGTVRAMVTTGGGSDLSIDWDSFLSEDDSEVQVPLSDDDPADVIHTSGTTGRPKALLARHRNVSQLPLGAVPDFTGEYFMQGQPVSAQVTQALISTAPAMGMAVLYLPSIYDPEVWVASVREHRPTAAYLAPAMVENLLGLTDIQPRDLASLRIVSVGSAPVAPSTLQRLDGLLPNARPQNSYALTELGSAYTITPPDQFEARLGSVGKPVPPLRLRIVDPDTGHDVPHGELGEVLAHPGDRGREFFVDPERQAEAWEDGWLHTHDLGCLDEDGYLYLVDRIDDVINRGGYSLHPSEPERAIYEDERVREAAVVGVPHDILGEDAVAFVVPRPDTGLTAADVLERLERRLGKGTRPTDVVIAESLPRNAAGKVLREQLRDRYLALVSSGRARPKPPMLREP